MIETNTKFQGVITALITPFKDGKIDEQAFVKLVERQIKAGVSGVVICGTTGESPTLSKEEKCRLFQLAVETANKQILIIAGVGSNCTATTIALAEKAEKLGVDGLLIVTPYYNKPTQEGLYQHYKAINDSVNIPIILYAIPSRTAVDLHDETIIRLAALKNILAIKDHDITRPARLKNKLNKYFYNFTGDDINALAYNANGGIGCISTAGNIVPELCVELQKLCFAKDQERALQLQCKLLPLYDALFCETNPGPAKYAASLLGLCNPELRLPLVMPSELNRKKISDALESLALINPSLIDKVITDQEVVLY